MALSVPFSKAQLLAKLVELIAALPWDATFQDLLSMLADNVEYLQANAAPLAHGHDGSTGTVAIVICTSESRPNPYTLGGLIIETDTANIRQCIQADPALWDEPLVNLAALLAARKQAAAFAMTFGF